MNNIPADESAPLDEEAQRLEAARLQSRGNAIQDRFRRLAAGAPERVFVADGNVRLIKDADLLGQSAGKLIGATYDIPVEKVVTAEDVLYWARLLCEEAWVTPEVIAMFISVAAAEAKVKLPLTR